MQRKKEQKKPWGQGEGNLTLKKQLTAAEIFSFCVKQKEKLVLMQNKNLFSL